MADIMITRVKNGWMVYPALEDGSSGLRNPRDTSVARDTGELADLVTEWAVGVLRAEEEREKPS